MKFYNVTRDDLGMYQCLLKNETNDLMKSILKYKYNLISNNLYIFKNGSSVNFICKNENSNKGRVVLRRLDFKKDKIDCFKNNFCHYYIENGSTNDNGIIQCIKFLKNKIKFIYAIILFISPKVDKKIENKHLNGVPYIFKVFSNNIEVKEGDTLYIPCIFTSFIFSSTLVTRWSYETENDKMITKYYVVDERNFTILKIPKISISHTGKYICEVASEYGLERNEFLVYMKPTQPLVYYINNIVTFITKSSLPIDKIIVKLTPYNKNLEAIEHIYDNDNILRSLNNFKYKGKLNIEEFKKFGEKYSLSVAVSHNFSRSIFSSSIRKNDHFILDKEFTDYDEEIINISKKNFKMILLKLNMFIGLVFVMFSTNNHRSLAHHQPNDNLMEESDTISFINHLKRKLGIEEDDIEIDVEPFENTIINGRHFGESYQKSEKIRKHFERTGILLNEDEFVKDNYDETKDIVLVGKKSPYEKDNDIINHFQFNKNIFKKSIDGGFFVVDLKNIQIIRNSHQRYYLQICKKNYDKEGEDEIILTDTLEGFNNSPNKKRKLYISRNFLIKLKEEMSPYLSVYAKVIVQELNNNSIFNVILSSTIKTLHLTLPKYGERKKRSKHPNCDPIRHGKSCCMIDTYINLHSFGELKNIAFPGVINVKRCVGECVLKDNQSPNSYLLDNYSNITIERQKCCRPTKFETMKFVLKKNNSTAVEISVDDLIVKSCECY